MGEKMQILREELNKGSRSGWVVQSVKKLLIYQALLGVLKQKVITYQANESLSISGKGDNGWRTHLGSIPPLKSFQMLSKTFQ
jgi:hypothetical protein